MNRASTAPAADLTPDLATAPVPATAPGAGRRPTGSGPSGLGPAGSAPTGPVATGPDWSDETGAQTAEYGIVTLAAVGFAGVLAVILAGADVQGLLLDLVKGALSLG
ncbi:DUF4244 domain-containing protein [Citricoccus sp. SGAir0253]|uniref:DUF4244 domain-containing protein n=1 Tax=Citricoccus sp. SGAir0253 TaxID=2567881 RepID=UPI0010CD0D34|nr:DUF4244 domain-containing protein [Citricoccus sp. SGAir0253]QCU79281.1 DUF4244 domain-containing protein [Citricoccus sp. SGAir0253]